MKKIISQKTFSIGITALFLLVVVFVSAQSFSTPEILVDPTQIVAPTNPATLPPPVHEGMDQVKTGGLSLNRFIARSNASFEQNLSVEGFIRGGTHIAPTKTVFFGLAVADSDGTNRREYNTSLIANKFITTQKSFLSQELSHSFGANAPATLCADGSGNIVKCKPDLIQSKDECPNIEGIQTRIPDGLIIEDIEGKCVFPPPPPPLPILTIQFMESGSYNNGKFMATLNTPLSVDITIDGLFADAYTNTCGVANASAQYYGSGTPTLARGETSKALSPSTLSAPLGTSNKSTIYNVLIKTDAVPTGEPIDTNGKVVVIGGKQITVFYDQCQ